MSTYASCAAFFAICLETGMLYCCVSKTVCWCQTPLQNECDWLLCFFLYDELMTFNYWCASFLLCNIWILSCNCCQTMNMHSVCTCTCLCFEVSRCILTTVNISARRFCYSVGWFMLLVCRPKCGHCAPYFDHDGSWNLGRFKVFFWGGEEEVEGG